MQTRERGAEEREAELRQRVARRREWLAVAVATAVLLSGVNALVQVGKAAVDYGCRHRWLAAECVSPEAAGRGSPPIAPR